MMNGYQFRLYPTREQEQILLRWIGCQRLIYNAKVSEDRYFRSFKRRFLAVVGEPIPIDQGYSHFKTELTPFLNEIPSQILRNGAVLWKQTYNRHFQGLGGRQKFQKRSGEQSVWITSELFSFAPQVDRETGEILRYNLQVGTHKFPVGEIDYVSHRHHGIPASIHISVRAGKWFLSFSAEDERVGTNSTIEAIAQELRQIPSDDLAARTCGADRGVAKPLVTSDGQVYDLQPVQKERIEKEREQKKKWQRRAARGKKGSKNQKKAYRKAARYQQYEANVRKEYAHQTSYDLVSDDRYTLYAFEDLKIQNMTRHPKAKQDEEGKWLKNGAKAKAGLNRVILSSAWGQVVQYTEYKALRAGKLVVKVSFAYSSQECAACGFTHKDNRPTQAEFVYRRCGHTDNADHNAAIVIARRGVRKVLSGEPLAKPKKSIRMRKTVGPERSEPVQPAQKPEETKIRRDADDLCVAHKSMSQETPMATLETPA